jgi:hypothetical protein
MVKHYVVTLTNATPIQLSSVLSVGENDHANAAVWMQPRGTNASPVYIGGSATLSSTNYGVRLEASSGGVPSAPFNPGEFSYSGSPGNRAPTKLSEFWVLGSTGDYLHLLVLWY